MPVAFCESRNNFIFSLDVYIENVRNTLLFVSLLSASSISLFQVLIKNMY